MNDHHYYKLPLWKDTYLESWTMRNLNVFISLDSMHLGLVCTLKRVLSESVILYMPLRTTWNHNVCNVLYAKHLAVFIMLPEKVNPSSHVSNK